MYHPTICGLSTKGTIRCLTISSQNVSKAGENKIVVDEDVVLDSVYNYSGEILIPSEVMRDSIIYKVTAIGLAWGNSAIQPFEDCVDITSVSLPNTLEKILP